MKYKIIEDVNISGKTKGDIIEAEEHAMAVYISKGQVEEVKEIKKVVKKVVKK